MANLITLILPMVIGGEILFLKIKLDSRVRSSLSWPSVEGKIIHSAIITSLHLGGYYFHPDVKHRYKIGRKSYLGKNVDLGLLPGWPIKSWAYKRVAKYPRGKMVQIYYNPNNPKKACLERTISGGETFVFYFTVGLLFYCGALAFENFN